MEPISKITPFHPYLFYYNYYCCIILVSVFIFSEELDFFFYAFLLWGSRYGMCRYLVTLEYVYFSVLQFCTDSAIQP